MKKILFISLLSVITLSGCGEAGADENGVHSSKWYRKHFDVMKERKESCRAEIIATPYKEVYNTFIDNQDCKNAYVAYTGFLIGDLNAALEQEDEIWEKKLKELVDCAQYEQEVKGKFFPDRK